MRSTPFARFIRLARFVVVGGFVVAAATAARAQIVKPKLELTPVVEAQSVHAGGSVKLALKIRLPQTVHVQSDKPRNPSLIPTVLKIDAPAGVTVGKITYPAPRDLTQAGQKEPLAVFGPDFTISVDLKLADDAAAGELIVPAHLRYQACDEAVCYPPAKADAQWTLHVAPGKD
jgi:thiol:disulfide interchange protein DsbD